MTIIPFRHGTLTRDQGSPPKVSQRQFINLLNHLHFMGEHCFAHVTYPLLNEDFLIRVQPDPCQGDEITCRIPENSPIDLRSYHVEELIIDDGKTIMNMPLSVIRVENHLFSARLDARGFVLGDRQVRRFQCSMVDAQLSQGRIEAQGMLEDFTPTGLRIRVVDSSVADPTSFDPARKVQVSLFREGKAVFSGECSIVRREDLSRAIIVAPIAIQQSRFKGRKLRNPRLSLVPTPKAFFTHPFSGKRVTYEIVDITTAGFSVHESADASVLMPGMIIPDVTILYAGGFKMSCAAQVIYRLGARKHLFRFGLAIIDLDIVTYNRFFDIYSNAHDVHANVSREVDMHSLWQFFFESGFIYPRKYTSLSQYKEDFKSTYEKLYHSSPEVFANFTYQNNGVIYGHVSIIKAYQRTWMIHHLAAKPMGRKRTGLAVLNHILNYFDGLYRMPSVGMDYMIFYFRPDNKFPDYFFGGFCRELKNPKACSMDSFAYLNVPRDEMTQSLDQNWSVQPCSRSDLADLRSWYEKHSGGLMIDAMGLEWDTPGEESMEVLYARFGLKRSCSCSALKHNGHTKAFFIADHSDMGINLSELLNSIKIIVLDEDSVSWEILLQGLACCAEDYGSSSIPVMVYPFAYLDRRSISYEKKYILWALDARYGDEYTEHLKQKARIRISKFLIKHIISRVVKRQ